MNCRVCGHDLETILDLGEQCLSGQFPKISEPDPPRFPLVLARCVECGLIQLRDTVDPKLMFTHYNYRSSVTDTMRGHLTSLSSEALMLIGRSCDLKILDIGGNDGELLKKFGPQSAANQRWLIDPSDVEAWPEFKRIRGFYPHSNLVGQKFDLIFTIACFYDANDPTAFVRAVRDNLAPGGLWCVEVSDVGSVLAGAWDSICHEHLCYYDSGSLLRIANEAGLHLAKHSYNSCNGGTLRCYFSDHDCQNPYVHFAPSIGDFADSVQRSRQMICRYLGVYRAQHKKVHLLGASTKANTVLQYCGITPDFVEHASDRDPRKHGRCTPGTRIPIISEEESRAMKPDVYLVGPWHFRDEIVAREHEFLDRGGVLLFPLPIPEEVRQ